MSIEDFNIRHVTGESVYVNDICAGDHILSGRVVYSREAHAMIKRFNLGKAKSLKGVSAIVSYRDIPGKNQMGPVVHDEVCLAEKEVEFIGQAIFLIAACDDQTARAAEQLIEIEYEPLPAITDLKTAISKNNLLQPPRKMECGDIVKAFAECEHVLDGILETGGQEHWYLETQSSLAVPGEGKEIKIYCSSQHPSETQSIVAEVLGMLKNEVEVEVKRMGGAFGGKETQANHYAVWSALLAYKTGKPVKIHLCRDDDQIMTGKRHPFLSKYKAGFSSTGKLKALDIELNADAGSSTDLTMAVLIRAMFHVDNAYYIPNLRVTGTAWKTNKPSNTAMRGFGGPQGMAVIETIIDKIARFLKKDALEVRRINFYQPEVENTTHYGQTVENNRLAVLYDNLVRSSEYYKRRTSINTFNSKHPWIKKGLAMTPVKFGISFTTSFLNQAGALVNIYKDGTVLIHHGGTEMGQGLHAKMITVASSEFGISDDRIKVSATNTSKVPNTSATAASSGSDLNGMAVKNAIDQLKLRLNDLIIRVLGNVPGNAGFRYQEGYIFNPEHPDQKISFESLIQKAYAEQISLSATGFYKTPDICYDKQTGKGKPFHYYAFGMACSEVELDILTGSVKVLRTDILHDAGKSISEKIDRGQVEGGFIQGLGWVTTEDMKYDLKGNLLNHSPDTYKIPAITDIPLAFRVNFLKDVPNPNTIRQSKAVGEPPFMLAFSVWLAIKDAISAVADHQFEPVFSLPATNEIILGSIEELKQRSGNPL